MTELLDAELCCCYIENAEHVFAAVNVEMQNMCLLLTAFLGEEAALGFSA